MSSSNNYGLPHPFGKSFSSKDDLPCVDKGERLIPSLGIGGKGSCSSLPPPLPVILPDPFFRRLEMFKVTQAVLACKHQDGTPVCAHVMMIKLHIDRLVMLGVVFPRKMVVDLVLYSFPKSCGQFVKVYYMTDHDVTLIDLRYLLIATKSAMIWHTGKAKFIGRSTSKICMDIGNNNVDSPEMISSLKGEKLAKVEKFDRKRKVDSKIVPHITPKESICFYSQMKGHWKRSCPEYLRYLRDGKVKLYGSTSESKRKKEA
ncbi:hypothetical protein Lser_V15G41327 [Lactuca serriola]